MMAERPTRNVNIIVMYASSYVSIFHQILRMHIDTSRASRRFRKTGIDGFAVSNCGKHCHCNTNALRLII